MQLRDRRLEARVRLVSGFLDEIKGIILFGEGGRAGGLKIYKR